MEFPIEIWLIIRSYQIPNKKYWMKMFNPCIQQLTPVDFNAFITPSLTASWWKHSYTHVTLTGVIYEDNGFTYYYNTVYYPNYNSENVRLPRLMTSIEKTFI